MDPAGRVIVGAAGSIFRLNPDGTPDPSFAAPSFAGGIFGIYLQPSGKVVYAVLGSGESAAASVTLRRLNVDGSPDPAYAGLSLPTEAGPQWIVGATTMTPDGSLWLDIVSSLPVSAPVLPILNETYRAGVIRIGFRRQF